MSEQLAVSNPFLLMLQPELVLAAMEKSERLNQLTRRMCRPLDRIPGEGTPTAAADAEIEAEADVEAEVSGDADMASQTPQ